MGLYSDFNDVQLESIPLFLIILLANTINRMRSLIQNFLQYFGFSISDPIEDYKLTASMTSVGSGLAKFIRIAEEQNLNRAFLYQEGKDDICVVCLCGLKEGEKVRRLACTHVFHKACLDGWLFDHLKIICPLCRSPLFSEDRCGEAERRVAADLVAWFSGR